MDPDIVMTLGIALGLVSFPSLIHNVLHDGRPSKIVGFFCLVSVVVMVIATLNKPGGYDVIELPGVFFSVLGRLA